MYVIKIFSDFCSSEKAKENYERIYDAFKMSDYGKGKKVYFTEEDVYTHAIILNQAMPPLKILPKNVIGFSFEPYELVHISNRFIEYAKNYIGKYYIGSKHNLEEPFVEGFGYMWFANPRRDIPLSEKKGIMSIIVSEKRFAPGHQYRHQMVEAIIKNHLPIDIYGRGSSFYKNSTDKNNDSLNDSLNNIKGEFHDESPYENYMFSICIENFRNHHYFSEKIMSPLMHNCMPIYWGCTNIHSYFEEVVLLTGDLKKDMNLIVDILHLWTIKPPTNRRLISHKGNGYQAIEIAEGVKNPLAFYKPTYSEKNKKKINLIENIDTLF